MRNFFVISPLDYYTVTASTGNASGPTLEKQIRTNTLSPKHTKWQPGRFVTIKHHGGFDTDITFTNNVYILCEVLEENNFASRMLGFQATMLH